MNIRFNTVSRTVLLMFSLFCVSTSALNAQVYFDSLYQDYNHIYIKVREFDMSFTEAMPITSSKVFILENEHVQASIKEYQQKFPDYSEQDLLVELSADISVKFLKEEVFLFEEDIVEVFHLVKKGDTLYSLALRYDITIDYLKKLNEMTTNALSVGDRLRVK